MSSGAVFDQNYYLTNNADVVLAISQGNFANALDHFNQFGGKELRAPNATFNPSYYAINNADVLNAVASGVFSNVFVHYQAFGETENRAPNVNLANFDSAGYLAANTDVAAAVTAGTFSSALDHFLAFGQNENRAGSGITASVNPGQTFTLTTGSDAGADFTGGSGADVFVGLLDDNTAANNTYGALDTLDGGDGVDTLQITADASTGALAMPAATVTNIETFLLRNASGQTLTFNTNNATGENLIVSDRSTAALTITNMAAGTTVEHRGNEVTTNGAITATYAAAATEGALNITGGTTGANAVAINGAGLTSLAISSSGAANTTGNITTSGTPTAVTITASSNLTAADLTVASNASAQSLTVSGAGNVTLTAAMDDDFASVDASGMTGNFTGQLNATVAATFTGGSGADSITTSTTGQTGTVSGGDGDDLLILDSSADINTTAEGAVYTNFETVRVNDGQALDMDIMTGSTITAIQVLDSSSAATSVTDMTAAQAADVQLRDFNNVLTLGVKGAGTVGSQDVLNITVSDGDTIANETLIATNTDGLDATIAGVETITINAFDNFDADALNNITGMTRLNITGGGTVDIIAGAVTLGSNGFVNAGDATGAVTFVGTAVATNAFAYTGSSGIDTVTDNAIGGNQINTGAGNDIVTLTAKTGGTATTAVTLGAGQDDVIVAMIGNDAIDAMLFNFAAGDSISDSSTTGISATLTDTITGLDGRTATAANGSKAEFDTEVQATSVTAGTAAVALGTTTVANAGDFFVHIASATVTNVYQDTDGDGVIEAGEFALLLTGIATNTLAAGDFTVTGGDLILLTT